MNSYNNLNNNLQNSLLELATPTSISYLWNWGSILGIAIVTQLLTGILLASHYSSELENSFNSVIIITRNINFGYEIRFIHINIASFFFICLFIHISRSLYTSSFNLNSTWYSGVTIILILIGTAFLGYVLPWGQISFWGATVITNLLSAIPYVGNTIVQWLWGGFSIENATLSRFFTLHFIIPIVLVLIIFIHITILHKSGSNNPTSTNQNTDNMYFHPFFSTNDIPSTVILITFILLISIISPFLIGDSENFNLANPLNTPIHIQPEWYFLFAYAILRSIPSNLGGVLALLISIISLFFLPIINNSNSTNNWMPNINAIFWLFTSVFSLLSWAGAIPVENPFENISNTLSIIYFPYLFSI